MFGVKVFLKEDEKSQNALISAEIDTQAVNPHRGAHKHPSGEYYMELSHLMARALLDLKRGAVPEAAIERISFEWGRDERFTEGKVKGGIYEYQGSIIAIRWFHNSSKNSSWRQADICVDCSDVKAFEAIFKLLTMDDFSTEMFKN
jgi:hypothetical protein